MKKNIKPIMVTTAVSLLALTQSCQNMSEMFGAKQEQPYIGQAQVIPAPKIKPSFTEESSPKVADTTGGLFENFPTQDGTPELLKDPAVNKAAVEPIVAAPVTVPEVEKLTHRVRKGDSLWKIAFLHGVSVDELTAENGLNKSKPLAIGVTLTIPAGGRIRTEADLRKAQANARKKSAKKAKVSIKKPVASKSSKPASISGETYTVKSGDSLWLIARRSNTTVKNLKELNNLTSDRLKVGSKLVINKKASVKVAKAPIKKEPIIQDPIVIDNTVEIDKEEPTPKSAIEPSGQAPIEDTLEDALAEDLNTKTSEPEVQIELDVIPHLVTKDDTLEDLATMYTTTVELIKKYNPGINGNTDLKDEMELKIPLMEK